MTTDLRLNVWPGALLAALLVPPTLHAAEPNLLTGQGSLNWSYSGPQFFLSGSF